MRRSLPIIVTLVFLAGCRKPAPRSSPEIMRLLELEQSMLSVDDENAVDRDAMLDETEGLAMELLVLEQAGEVHRAVDVYVCPVLEDTHVCRFMYADDTIHTTEFPERYEPIVLRSDESLKVSCLDGCSVSPVFYLGEPGEMHSSGYSSVVEVPVGSDATLDLPPLPADSEHILYTVVRGATETMHRKYVWVVRTR